MLVNPGEGYVFTTSIETYFAASHQLHGYEGPCKALHGHTWKVRVEIQTEQIDDIGISFDFKKLKSVTETVLSRLDHKHINDTPPFDTINPTAENLARYIYRETWKQLPDAVAMHRVIVWESVNSAVSYSEP